ncbi:lethal(2) giant larvae protein homolog 1-like isoform X3 [Lethenteron reissneri]|uniref:lethal(2) giant larvae protein homolog 1-like isoform X3 n=1 Tax=Lethenteron reissneri TaxID=7753 RepID=UPI002AB5FC55|nr:lethal(2) giant larvae protein homolog 1-like isoform X3 [Lethenteron reissneri]
MMRLKLKRPGHDPHREKLKQELFAFNKTVEHGFPHQPSALAYDPDLRLMAIGTKSGAVKIYGAPGVEFTGLHHDIAIVTQLHFLPGQARVVSLLDDGSLHLWEIVEKDGYSTLTEVQAFTIPSRPGAPPSLARVTVLSASVAGDRLYVGTEGGVVSQLELPAMRLLDDLTLTQEDLLHGVPDEYRGGKALGPIEAVQEHPRDPHRLLVGFSRGLMLLWDQATRRMLRCFPTAQQLESVTWQRNGTQFVSSHNDGSYRVWHTGSSSAEEEDGEGGHKIPYGPYPCKAINKIQWLLTRGDPYIVLSGGMPRASYGDRHSVTVIHGTRHVAFDFTSRVIDFFTVCNEAPDSEYDAPQALIVLVEEELVAIDLRSESWAPIPPPYLASLHSSAITCSHHVSAVPLKIWERIARCGRKQEDEKNKSHAEWPVNGGINRNTEPALRDLLLTGHEDGSVRFWDASGVALKQLYKLGTANVFLTEADHAAEGEDEEWPPFRKVGCFDPYSDDPRLGIQKISLCKFSGQMALAGSAGQVLVMELNDDEVEHEVDVYTVDLLEENETFRWKGHERLTQRAGRIRFPAGFQPQLLVQCSPPASVTSLALHPEWRLVAFGTSHGLALFDLQQRRAVMSKCTLHPNDALALEGPLSRVKSLKKSLRQSFRRISKSRASGRKRPPRDGANKCVSTQGRLDKVQEAEGEVELAPVQRRIEARSADDSLSGVVKCIYFADTFLRDGSHHGPSLWAGTNAGIIFAYTIDVPSSERRSETPVEARLAKEIQLMHRAPVVGLTVLDGKGSPLPEPLEVLHDLAKSPEMGSSHSLLIISEEQFKVFALPRVGAKNKFKLTATEGSRVRKVALATFASAAPAGEDYSESCLVCLTNLGEVHAYSVPALRLQARHGCMRREDVSGIASCVFTKSGQGFYLISPSEFERFSLSAKSITEPLCAVQPKARDVPTRHSAKDRQRNSTRSNGSSSSVGEAGKKKGKIMENALLTDSSVLEEIQETLSSSNAAAAAAAAEAKAGGRVGAKPAP